MNFIKGNSKSFTLGKRNMTFSCSFEVNNNKNKYKGK